MFKHSVYAYYACYLLGFILMMVINLKDHDRYGIKKRPAVMYTLYTYVCGIVGAILIGKLYDLAHAAVGIETDSSVAIMGAVIFTPFLLLIFPTGLKNWKKIMDMLTPGILLILTLAKFGCFLNACCPGRECSFGIYSESHKATLFPSQIFETATMLIVLLISTLYVKRSKHFVEGTAYPFTFAIYSLTRFFWEFMRYYKDERMRTAFLGMTFWQLVCLIVFVCCAVLFAALQIKAKKQRAKA